MSSHQSYISTIVCHISVKENKSVDLSCTTFIARNLQGIFTSKHSNMPVGTELLGELIIVSLEMFLSYAWRTFITTKPKKPTTQTRFSASLAQFLKAAPVIYMEKRMGCTSEKPFTSTPRNEIWVKPYPCVTRQQSRKTQGWGIKNDQFSSPSYGPNSQCDPGQVNFPPWASTCLSPRCSGGISTLQASSRSFPAPMNGASNLTLPLENPIYWQE